MEILRGILHNQLTGASAEWDRKQIAQAVKEAEAGRLPKRQHRVVVAVENRYENFALRRLKLLLEDTNLWMLMSAASFTEYYTCRAESWINPLDALPPLPMLL